ncbi:MAG: insulinase family protein [Planctomycetota bacterium]|jgi:predicted Zn-dependent peptidase|nr:MAG: insulinase family protein [Planctomycetota bacterium]
MADCSATRIQNPIRVRMLECGMPLLVEEMAGVRTAAVSWLVPAGNATDPEGEAGDGWSSLLAELSQRGAGGRDSRQFSDALDRVGVQRSVSPASIHIVLGATLIGDRMMEALPLFADLIVRPHLPAEALDAVRSLAIQSLESLQDDPQHRVTLRLRERHLPPPFNRSGYGNLAAYERADIHSLRADWMRRVRPIGSILSVAGAVDADELAAKLDELLSGWHGGLAESIPLGESIGGIAHEEDESNQTHIAMGLSAPSEREPESLLCRLATNILGGETSSRLFTEVRERRSLCYSVNAGYSGGRDRGMVAVYAGSTPERAQETLDTIRAELEKFEHGVSEGEFRRAKIGMKSRLVMQGESTAARAAALGSDWYRLGRCRSLGELSAEVDAVTLDGLNDWIGHSMSSPWRDSRTLCTVGKSALDVPVMA